MPREQSKCREWEKERRNRLNDGFTNLSKLLPSYDPSVTISKIEVLTNAASFIEELQAKIKVLISENNEEATKKVKGEEYKKLYDRIKRLLGKNEQLCCLLREAKITIPPGCAMVKKFKSCLFWSDKILPEQAKTLQKKEKENENVKKMPRKFTNKKQNKVGGQSGTPKHRKAILNRSDSKKIRNVRKKKVKPLAPSKCVIVLSQPSMTQSCYVITNAPSNNILGGTSTVISNSGLITNPMVSSKATKTVSSIPPLGPGTLILANGTIMPVLPQQTVLPLASQIITRAPIILVPKNSVGSTTSTVSTSQSKVVSTSVKVLPRIKPKYCLTKTTQVNKVPIPALTSRYSNPEVVLKKSEPKIVKKVAEKKIETKENEKPVTVETGEKRKVPSEEAPDAKKAKTIADETTEKEQDNLEAAPVPCEKPPEEPTKQVEKATETPKITETKKPEENLDLSMNHSELSNDIFASLQVPAGCQNPESTSPTAAFLLAFPLVSSLTGVKVTEVTEEDNTDSQRETPTLLQIGTMDSTKPTQSETLTPSLLNLDNLSFFSSKDIGGFYNSFESGTTTATVTTSTVSTTSKALHQKKMEFECPQQTLQQQQQPPRQQQQQTQSQQPALQQQHPQSLQQQQQQAKAQQTTQQQHPQTQQSLQQQHPQTLQTKPQLSVQQQQLLQQPKQQQQLLQQPKQQQQQSQPLQQQQQQLLQQPKQQPQPLQQQLLQQPKQQSQPLQQQQLLQQPKQQSQPLQQQHRQEKTQLVPCFDNHNAVPNFGVTVSTNSITQPISYQMKPSIGNVDTKQQTACANNYNQKTFTCNTFNEGPKVSTNIKSYPEPLYTNSSTYTYGNSETNFNQSYYKDIPKSDNRSYYSLNYENYADYRKNDTNSTNTYFPSTNYYANTNYSKDKFNSNTNHTNNTQKKTNSGQVRPPINWMTTPDNRLQTPTDYVLPQFTKESEFYPSNTFTNTQTTYFNTNPMYPANTNEAITNQEPRKSLDLSLVPPVNSYQRNEVEDNQFTWSPTKIPQFLDPPHSFVSSTLPTLVGDLALGNPLTFGEQKDKCQKKDRRVKYEGNQGNFLSVSQLVDHGKEVVPARTTTRRNSGGRSSGKKVPQKTQRKETKDVYSNNTNSNNKVEVKGMKQLYSGGTSEVFCDSTQKNRASKNNYSAEALIGSQMQDKRQQNYNNKPISVSSFLHDNIIPYFPTVDLPQDNSYIQQNQTYQTSSFSHNFPSTFQNNTYTANTFIPTTTITSTYNFMHDVSHDYDLFPAVPKDKNCAKNPARNPREQQCSTSSKKTKRKHSNDLPGFVDFPSFLSMPGSINSPILPDDFHTHTGFLQPTPQLYPCKNPFTKPNDLGSGALLPLPPVPGPRSNIQHPEISPINSAGTSLTNFNLSTIFPEINNKGALDAYSEPRVKENARSYTTTVQVSFNDKPTFSFSYINCTTAQTYSNQ